MEAVSSRFAICTIFIIGQHIAADWRICVFNSTVKVRPGFRHIVNHRYGQRAGGNITRAVCHRDCDVFRNAVRALAGMRLGRVERIGIADGGCTVGHSNASNGHSAARSSCKTVGRSGRQCTVGIQHQGNMFAVRVANGYGATLAAGVDGKASRSLLSGARCV